MKPIFQSNARSRRHRQAQTPEPQTEQTPFFAAADQHDVQNKPQPFFQAKAAGVKIGQPNDVYEQEADAVANKVVNGQTAHSTNGGAAAGVQRLPITPLGSSSLQRLSTPEEDKMPGTNDARMAQDKEIQEKPEAGSPMLQKMDAPKEEEKPVQKMGEKEEEPVQAKEEEEQPVQKMEAPKEEEPLQKMGKKEEEPVQTKEEEEQPVQAKTAPGAQNASPNLGARLSQKKGSGNPLPKSVRAEMEQGIGADFSSVRIHTDSEAVQMNKDVHAQAFTHGHDVYFNSGKYSPESTEGKRLLAHELTHVVQQGGGELGIQRQCVDGTWNFEFDGCSADNYGIATSQKALGLFDKDDPAGGGKSTQFGSKTRKNENLPCDLHDICYQTCDKSDAAKKKCDLAMARNMVNKCSSGKTQKIKAECIKWAGIYYGILGKYGAEAFNERQKEVCACGKKTDSPKSKK